MLNVGTIMPRWPRAANGLKDGAGRWGWDEHAAA